MRHSASLSLVLVSTTTDSVSEDGSTVYGYTSTEDSSTLCGCSHSGYIAAAALYDPDGSFLGDTQESGFSSSVSALTDGVSGNYQSSGAGIAYCSCLQGEFGGGGTTYPVAVSCPTTITISGTAQLPLQAGLNNNFPTYLTGLGIMATMQVGPGNTNGAAVTENVSNSQTACPAGVAFGCSGNATFTVGPSPGGTYFGTQVSGAGNNQFQDEHAVGSSIDRLGNTGVNSCTETCSQTYSACNKQIGSFTITRTYTHSSISGTPVTLVTITKQ